MADQKLPKLIVVMAFDPDETGEMQTVFGPQDYQTEDRAVREAKNLASKHAGVIAWSREANVDIGEYGADDAVSERRRAGYGVIGRLAATKARPATFHLGR